MTESSRKYLFEQSSDADLLTEYRQQIRQRDAVGYFTLPGKLVGETRKMVFDELKLRGLESEAASVALTEELRETDRESIMNLIGRIETAKDAGGILNDLYDDGNPTTFEAMIVESILWVLNAAAERTER